LLIRELSRFATVSVLDMLAHRSDSGAPQCWLPSTVGIPRFQAREDVKVDWEKAPFWRTCREPEPRE